jgi:hypothetical protein
MNDLPFEKTLIIWWRYGKEHGDDELRINPPEVVRGHWLRKINRFCDTPDGAWRWFQVNEDMIVERWDENGPDTCIYYLLDRGLFVIENIHLPEPDDNWKWLICLCDYIYDVELGVWLVKSLFLKVCVEADNHAYHLVDLPDLAQALDTGLISCEDSRDLLRRVDEIVNQVARGQFPFPEIETAQAACHKLGW